MRILFPIAVFLVSAPLVSAIPNSIFGNVGQANSPLNGTDLTDTLLGNAVWSGEDALPGDWRAEASVPGTKSSHLLARPKVFGEEALLVRALHREGVLEEIQVTFVDAGSYFGYYDEEFPEDLSPRKREEEALRRLREKQTAFTELYQAQGENIRQALLERAGTTRTKKAKIGKSRTLRAEVTEFPLGALTARLLASEDRLVRVSFTPNDLKRKGWMDRALAELSERDYLEVLAERTSKSEIGDQLLGDVGIVPQGYKPYCGLNTLTMAGRYLGMHLDEDWLAAAGKFQNTGSAAGSQMLSLYSSVANEAGLQLKRSTRFDENLVRKSIQEGLPVVVWRRWARERDHLHSRISREVADGNTVRYEADEDRARWPTEKAPLHASVIVGINEERKEVLFLESWSPSGAARRMPVEEMAATAYLTFCFRP